MLPRKARIPFSRRISNAVCNLTKSSSSNEKNSPSKEDSVVDPTRVGNRCAERKKALENCPKKDFVQRCRKQIFAGSVTRTKCSWNSGDDYRRAHRAIQIRSTGLTKLVETTVRAIIREMRHEITKIRCDENSFVDKILRSVEPKILEFANLDPVCAMKKKRDVFVLNDKTRNELMIRHCESQLGIESIECELEKLAQNAKLHADRALDLVASCRRKIESPGAMIHCIEHSSRNASKILDNVKADFENRINEIKIIKEATVKEEKQIVEDVTKNYEKKMVKLLDGLIACIMERKSN